MSELFVNKWVSIEKELSVGVFGNMIVQATNFRAYQSRGQYSIIAFQWGVSVVFLIVLFVNWKMGFVKKKIVTLSIMY